MLDTDPHSPQPFRVEHGVAIQDDLATNNRYLILFAWSY